MSKKIRSVLPSLLAVALFAAGCQQLDTRNEGERRPTKSEPTVVRTSSYSMPFEITYYRLARTLDSTESVCVARARDLNDGSSHYQRSGDFVTDKFYTNFSQYSLRARLLRSLADHPGVQQEAQAQGCTLIAKPQVESWSVELISQRDMRVTLQMYDTSSLELVNSFAINAGKEADMVSGIIYLVHKLYFPN